ncbi:MAG: hypothetical protein ACREOZ_03330, partial [Gloeomargaritales cyanobacterium]
FQHQRANAVSTASFSAAGGLQSFGFFAHQFFFALIRRKNFCDRSKLCFRGEFRDAMTFKSRSNFDFPIRLIAAIILQLGFAVYFTIGGGALGTGLGIGDTTKEFLFIFIPTFIIIFLCAYSLDTRLILV